MKKLLSLAVALMTVCAVSAQNELVTKYNDGAAAISQKDYETAAKLFDEVIDQGIDSEDPTVLNCVATAKKYIPICYQNMGAKAAAEGNFDKAAELLSTAAERAELYGETQTQAKANMILAKVYQVQGGTAFNNKDYATAAEVFAKGYAANPRNTEMALNLAMSYCELERYDEGMDIYRNIMAMNPDRYADAIAQATEMVALYTNNRVAKMQAANDYDGIIAMSEKMLADNPADALAYKIRIQAYSGKKDYDKVIELGEETAMAQTSDEDKSDVYFLVGAAYNAKYNASGNKDLALKDKAVEALKKVVAGSNVEAAAKSVADLSK